MRNDQFLPRNIGALKVTPAAAIADDCHDMVRQMALPLIAQRRVKGALGTVARDSGVSYSKLRKIYYRLTDHILAVEFRSIAATYTRYVESQERALERELAELRELRAAREMREWHGVLNLETPAKHLGAVDREASRS